MDELLTRHSTIMDRYDPDKRIGLVVDEWGTWYSVEPGTNPGFLYQQNSLRDAIVAGISLNTFNKHCDRVSMAQIAQTINVLQSVILTDKEKMLLTPTYWVFHMMQVHQMQPCCPFRLSATKFNYATTRPDNAGRGQGGQQVAGKLMQLVFLLRVIWQSACDAR